MNYLLITLGFFNLFVWLGSLIAYMFFYKPLECGNGCLCSI